MRMPIRHALTLATLTSALSISPLAFADVAATVERVGGNDASSSFDFKNAPKPVGEDLANNALFSIIDGEAEQGARLDALRDGKLPESNDDPGANFFFGMNTVGGRIRVDLKSAQEIGQINTYSWHSGERAPQRYTVYAAEGNEPGLNREPKLYVDPAHAGWTKLADVDTRDTNNAGRRRARGGQVAVSLNDPDFGTIGTYRYLLFDVQRTEDDGPYANTFFSELDIVAPSKVQRLKPDVAAVPANQRFKIVIDTEGLSPEMTKWAHEKLEPVCREWYPKIVEMLPSDGYRAPKTFTIVFRDDMGGTPAAAAGTRVMCNLPWFEKNQEGEGIGAVVHEMAHVVQQYRFGSRGTPFWLQEGIPDYVRWFVYEPEKNGARIRDIDGAKYDAAYRISANFLNWATITYDKDLVKKLNAAVRSGKYKDEMWKDLTGGKTLEQLNEEWKTWLRANQPTTR